MSDNENFPSFKEFLADGFSNVWDWLGIGDPTWWKITLVVLATLFVLFIFKGLIFTILHILFAAASTPARRNTNWYDREERDIDSPRPPVKRMRSGFEHVDPSIYNFHIPVPKPDLSNLRDNIDLSKLSKPAQPDWKKAESLFVGKRPTNPKLDWGKAEDLFVRKRENKK